MQEAITTTDMIIRLAVSLVLGGLVGYERERDSQPAGLRTHMILVLGACLAMMLSVNVAVDHGSDPARLAAQVISGIGFLGAGAILRLGVNIKGLTTATSLWTMAVVGISIGYGYYIVGVVATALMLLVLSVVGLFENRFIRTHVVRNFVIQVNDNPKVIRQVRKTISKLAEKIVSFTVQKSIKDKHFRLEVIAHMDRSEKLEDLVEEITAIEGVRGLKIE